MAWRRKTIKRSGNCCFESDGQRVWNKVKDATSLNLLNFLRNHISRVTPVGIYFLKIWFKNTWATGAQV